MRKQNSKLKRSKNPTHFAKYTKIRNEVTMILRTAKQNYFNVLTSANSKQFWKTAKLVNIQQQSIPTLNQGNVDDVILMRKKSNMLNSYFSKCWNRSEPPLTDSLGDSYAECDETCSDHLLCMVQGVAQLIKGLDLSKANDFRMHAQGHI